MIYKAGIIGCGRIGCGFDDDPNRKYIATHAGAYSAVDNVSLVALVDKDKEKLEKYKEKFHVSSTFTDYKEMLEKEKLDIVSICTWNDTHYEITKNAVKAGVKAIFCEKPIASNLDEAEKMVKLCNEKQVILMIDHQRRFCKFHQAVKDFIDNKKLGEIQQISFYYTAGIANTGSHMFDLLRFFFGNVEWVCAFKSKNISSNKNDPNFDGIIKFKNGIFCTIQACNVKNFLIFELDILGSKGRLRITHSGLDLDYYDVKDSDVFLGYKEIYKSEKLPINKNIGRGAMIYGVKHLVDCLKNNKMPISSGEDGVKALELICAFHESAKKDGERIYLPLKKSFVEIKSR